MSDPTEWGAQPVENPTSWGAVATENPAPPAADTMVSVPSFGLNTLNPFAGATEIPPAVIDRMRQGAALTRIIGRAGEMAAEGFGGGPVGLSDDTRRQMRELHILPDPEGSVGPFSALGASLIERGAFAGDAVVRGINAGIYGLGGIAGQISREFGESQGESAMAERDVIALANQRMIESGMGTFGRPHVTRDGVISMQPIGGLPTAEDFKTAASALGANGSLATEEQLRQLWWERGIHPHEAAFDASQDAFLHADLTGENPNPPDLSGLATVTSSPVPDGAPRSALAKTGDTAIDTLIESGPVRRAIDSPTIDRSRDVPGGASMPPPDEIGFHWSPAQFDQFSGSAGRAWMGEEGDIGYMGNGVYLAKTSGNADLYREYAGKAPGEGYSYTVRVTADPDKIVDFERPYSEQSAFVRDALAPMIENQKKWFEEFGVKKYDNPENYTIRDLANATISAEDLSGGLSPHEAYLAPWLQKRGILGVRHTASVTLDSGHRVSNGDLVIFDERNVEATHRNGIPLNAAATNNHPIVYVDRNLPTSITVDGATFDPAEPLAVRVTIERAAMQALERGGMATDEAARVASEWAAKAESAWYEAHGIDQARAGEALRAFMERGEPKPEPTAEERAKANDIIRQSEETGDLAPTPGGADVTDPASLPTPEQQPLPPPGSMVARMQALREKLFSIGRDIQMNTSPMTTGSKPAMAIAKDFASTIRRNRWEWARIDQWLLDSPQLKVARERTGETAAEQRERMWNAADEESVARQLGEDTTHQGLATLEPEERTIVEDLQARSQAAWEMAKDLDMVEGDGLPAYTPRMLIHMATGGKPMPLDVIGRNLRVRTGQMLHREHMMAEGTEEAAKAKVRNAMEKAGMSPEEIEAATAAVQIARDIRALPLATAQLEDAIAGRTLINAIQDYGERTGSPTVSIGAKPENSWFTIENHPAFYRFQPRMENVDGAMRPLKDENGNIVFDRVPIYVHGDFEGPLRAVLTKPSGPFYSTIMSIKGKTMSLIMNSPLIHNAVEWGRAMPAMPGKVVTFRVYFEGNRAKNDPVTMREAIDGGLVPIGHRFFNQDITSIMEQPNLTPGRSWTSQVLAAVPGLFDPAAGDAVKAAIDKAGDFWHNTMLWDRVGDLQMGLYVNFRDGLLQKGVDRLTASRVAAHWANRYAGALPAEAMSDGARKIANLFMFSRSFTMGNLGTMKDMLNGLPRDVMAQLERDGGFTPDVAASARSMARRKAIGVVALDVALMYIGNSILQSSINVLRSGGGQADPSSPFAGFAKGGSNFGVRQDWLAAYRGPLDAEMSAYAQRFHDALQQTGEHPASLLFPIPIVSSAADFASHVSSTYQNEPRKQDRIMVGHAADGTAVYMRNPVGKIGEEFTGYLTGPLDMLKRKLGTIVRPLWEILSNDRGFGHKVYDPDAKLPADQMRNAWEIAKVLAGSQLPEGQITALSNLVTGDGDARVNAAAALGPFAGVTFSPGAPGGPAVGELYNARARNDYRRQLAMPDIRRMIQQGDLDGARAAMTSLGMTPALQRFTIRTTQNPSLRLSPRALRDFYRPGFTSPEDQMRMQQQLH